MNTDKKEFKMPTDEQMPAALAELMGWKYTGEPGTLRCKDPEVRWCGCGMEEAPDNSGCQNLWNPMTDRNHSRLAVKECLSAGLIEIYAENLADTVVDCVFQWDRGTPLIGILSLVATPAQESRAAYQTLWHHHNQKNETP